MSMSTRLVESPVQFIEDREQGIHKYYLGFEELTGVTSILNAVIFRDKYCGISDSVLANAARRGTAIHEAIQAYMEGRPDHLADDLLPYKDDAKEALDKWNEDGDRSKMKAIATEYLVSDCKQVATKIDVVTPTEADNEIDIADIKTTYQLDEEYLSWQLSVEKYLTEKQNPGTKVRRLLYYWWNRQTRDWYIKEVADKGTIMVERLLAAWIAGEFWGLPQKAEVPALVLSIANVYAELELECQTAEARRDEFRTRLMEAMKQHGVKSFKADGFSVTYTAPGTTSKFDKKALLAARPDLKEIIEKYTKDSARSESISVRLSK